MNSEAFDNVGTSPEVIFLLKIVVTALPFLHLVLKLDTKKIQKIK